MLKRWQNFFILKIEVSSLNLLEDSFFYHFVKLWMSGLNYKDSECADISSSNSNVNEVRSNDETKIRCSEFWKENVSSFRIMVDLVTKKIFQRFYMRMNLYTFLHNFRTFIKNIFIFPASLKKKKQITTC